MSGRRREDGAETSHRIGGKVEGWRSRWMNEWMDEWIDG